MNKKEKIVKELFIKINSGKNPNSNYLCKKYNISFKKFDIILQDLELDICNNCYSIHNINWGELTSGLNDLTYCDKCIRKGCN